MDKEMETTIREIREDTARIREGHKVHTKKKLAAVGEEKGELRKGLDAVREELRGREEKWQAEEADWMNRMKMIKEIIEVMMEQREKKERKNDVIIARIRRIRGNIDRRVEE
jgi:predicted  nucleic acid-binding Zn-ribbon protein